MKKYLALFVFITISTFVYSQENSRDIVYMKDGTVIKGVIIEQVPNQYVKIESEGKRLIIYQLDIQRIARESPDRVVNKIETTKKRKGYIGLSLSPSIRIGDFANETYGKAKTGLHFNLINFGYLITDNLGITATGFVATNPLQTFGAFEPWKYGSLNLGPLLSFSLSEKINLDIRPMIGCSLANLPDRGLGYTSERDMSLAFNLGTVFRYYIGNSGNKVSLLLTADYFSTKAYFNENNIEQNIGTISFGLGIAYNLK